MVKSVSFTGTHEVEKFKSAIKKQSPGRFLHDARMNTHGGLNMTEFNSPEIKDAFATAREKHAGDNLAQRLYDHAEVVIKQRIKEKTAPLPLSFRITKALQKFFLRRI